MEPDCFIKVEPADDFPMNGEECLATKKYEESYSISHQTLVKIEPTDNAVGNTQSNTSAPPINDETFFGQTNCASSIGTNQCSCSYCTTADDFEKNHNLAAKPVDTSGHYIKATDGWNGRPTSNQGTEQILLSNPNKASVSRLIDEDEHECLRTYGKKSTNCEHCNRLFRRELEEVSQLLEKKRKESVWEESVAKHKKKPQTFSNSLGTQRFWRRDDVRVGPTQMFNIQQVNPDNCIQVIPNNQTDAIGQPSKQYMEQRGQIQGRSVYEGSVHISGQSKQLSNRIDKGQITVKQDAITEYQGSGIDNPGRNGIQETPGQIVGIDQQQVAGKTEYKNDSDQAPHLVLDNNPDQVSGRASKMNEIHDDGKALTDDQCKIFLVKSTGQENQLVQPGSAQHTLQDHGGRKNGSVEYPGSQEVFDHENIHDCAQHGIEERNFHQHQFHANENINNKHLAFVLEGKTSCKHQEGRKGRITSKCDSCDKLFREKLQELENLQLPSTKPLPKARPSPKPKPQELNRNKCPGCHKQFFEALHQLDLQLRATHRPICCSKCNLLFTTTAAFEDHKEVCGEAKEEVDQQESKGQNVCSDSDSVPTLSDVRLESDACQCSKSHPKRTEIVTEIIRSETDTSTTGTPVDVVHVTSAKDSRAPIHLSKNGRVRVSSLVVSHPELKSLSTDERRPYQCRICNKCFRNECHLEYHIRTHTGERPHSCDVCDKSFAQPSVLLRHYRRVHTNERPFRCPKCAKSFFTHSEMKKHLERH